MFNIRFGHYRTDGTAVVVFVDYEHKTFTRKMQDGVKFRPRPIKQIEAVVKACQEEGFTEV